MKKSISTGNPKSQNKNVLNKIQFNKEVKFIVSLHRKGNLFYFEHRCGNSKERLKWSEAKTTYPVA